MMKFVPLEPIDARSLYALRRFALKLGMIVFPAFLQIWTPWGFGKALLALTLSTAAIDIVLALYLCEHRNLHVLGYWDEALAFATIGISVGLFFVF